MVDALALSPAALDHAWLAWLENHGVFAVSVFNYKRLNSGWLRNCITVDAPALLKDLAAQGGLVLTYHCHHQNTIAALIGKHCGNMTALAARADSSPSYPILGSFIDLINRDSARWFGEGTYLFNDSVRRAISECRSLLEGKKVLLALCDVDWTNGKSFTFLGHRLHVPIGALTIAQQLDVPIITALMVPTAHGLTLYMRRLPAKLSVDEMVAAYFTFLEEHVRMTPACWQGWEWLNHWPADLPLNGPCS